MAQNRELSQRPAASSMGPSMPVCRPRVCRRAMGESLGEQSMKIRSSRNKLYNSKLKA